MAGAMMNTIIVARNMKSEDTRSTEPSSKDGAAADAVGTSRVAAVTAATIPRMTFIEFFKSEHSFHLS